ncbi:MAG: hypothetical protein FJW21_09850 [Acidimicrobiia bacterium]|nr:hypothetical protein [Acidimicrobiia bacterium]
MSDFQVKADAVDVEAIMRQIRARIREKRGVDYTEADVQALASAKLEQFLDPKGVRSDLVEQFRRKRTVSAAPPNYSFEDSTIYDTHRGLLRTIRRLLNPILKLFMNPQPIGAALHIQAKVNEEFHRRFRIREEMDPLYYELVHNLALEVTRLGIEVHNLKMRAESLSSRMDFDERRGRALESVVQYRPPQRQQPPAQRPPQAAAAAALPASAAGVAPGADVSSGDAPVPSTEGSAAGDAERRRRRRRRRRRPGQNMAEQGGAPNAGAPEDAETSEWVAEGGADSPDAGPDEQ